VARGHKDLSTGILSERPGFGVSVIVT